VMLLLGPLPQGQLAEHIHQHQHPSHTQGGCYWQQQNMSQTGSKEADAPQLLVASCCLPRLNPAQIAGLFSMRPASRTCVEWGVLWSCQ